jgi:hypothetical protein
MITVKAMMIWWLYKVVEREIRLLDIVTFFYYVWCISDECSNYGILIICDYDDSNGYDDMMVVYVK